MSQDKAIGAVFISLVLIAFIFVVPGNLYSILPAEEGLSVGVVGWQDGLYGNLYSSKNIPPTVSQNKDGYALVSDDPHNFKFGYHGRETVHGNATELAGGEEMYFRKDSNGIVRQYPCNTPSIRKNIRLAISLELLESEKWCAPTQSGLLALDPDRFDLVLQQAVIALLERKGILWTDISNAIEYLTLPDAGNLFKYLSPNIAESAFRSCLLLLSQCGGDIDQNILSGYQKKLYLTDEKDEKIRAEIR